MVGITRGGTFRTVTSDSALCRRIPTPYTFPDTTNYKVNVRQYDGTSNRIVSLTLDEAQEISRKSADMLLRITKYSINNNGPEYVFRPPYAGNGLGTFTWESEEIQEIELSVKEAHSSHFLRFLLSSAIRRIRSHGAVRFAIRANHDPQLKRTIQQNPHFHPNTILAAMPRGISILDPPTKLGSRVSWVLGIPGRWRPHESLETKSWYISEQDGNDSSKTEQATWSTIKDFAEKHSGSVISGSLEAKAATKIKNVLPYKKALSLSTTSSTNAMLAAFRQFRNVLDSELKEMPEIESKQGYEIKVQQWDEPAELGEQAMLEDSEAASIQALAASSIDLKARTADLEILRREELPGSDEPLSRPKIRLFASASPDELKQQATLEYSTATRIQPSIAPSVVDFKARTAALEKLRQKELRGSNKPLSGPKIRFHASSANFKARTAALQKLQRKELRSINKPLSKPKIRFHTSDKFARMDIKEEIC